MVTSSSAPKRAVVEQDQAWYEIQIPPQPISWKTQRLTQEESNYLSLVRLSMRTFRRHSIITTPFRIHLAFYCSPMFAVRGLAEGILLAGEGILWDDRKRVKSVHAEKYLPVQRQSFSELEVIW